MTYAIFKAAGFQYRAELGEVLRLPTLGAEAGETVTFDQVLLGSSDGEVLVGRPTLKGAAVRAQVLRHGRADKVIVFKFKRRKNYRRKSGHRQDFTEVRINEIDLGGERRVTLEEVKPAAKAPKKKSAPKKKAETAKKKAETAKKAEPKAEAKAAPKKKAAAKPKAKAEAKPKAKAKAKPKSKKKKS